MAGGVEGLPRRGRGAQGVAGLVVGQDQRVPALEARAVVGRGGVAGVVVEADDPVPGDAEVLGDEAEPLALGDAELASGGVDEAELRAPLPHFLLERAPRRGPRAPAVPFAQ